MVSPNKEESMLTVHQLALMLNVSDSKALRLCEGGHIPAKNVNQGGRNKVWRIKKSVVMAYIDVADNTPENVPPSRSRGPTLDGIPERA